MKPFAPSSKREPKSSPRPVPGATAGDQATLVFLWQATMGILEMLLVTGLVILPMGLIALGVAMFGAPDFGKGFGGTSVVLGALGAGGASLMIVDPASVLGPMAGMFTLIIFHFVVGWKVYRLSRDSAGSPEDRGYTENGVRADGDSNPSKYLDAVQQGR